MKIQKIKADENGVIQGLKPDADYLVTQAGGVQIDDQPVAHGGEGTQRHVICLTATEAQDTGETIVGKFTPAAPQQAEAPKVTTFGPETAKDGAAK